MHAIRLVDEGSDLERLVEHLRAHVAESGRDGAPLFQPQPRGVPWTAAEKLALYRQALAAPIGSAQWRRFWIAVDDRDGVLGHADLRAHPFPSTSHRALLGLGVERAHRRRGVGSALLEHVIAWARTETELAWIDLNVLAGNEPAQRVYRRAGFRHVVTRPDLFRVDGESIGDVEMTLPIRAG